MNRKFAAAGAAQQPHDPVGCVQRRSPGLNPSCPDERQLVAHRELDSHVGIGHCRDRRRRW